MAFGISKLLSYRKYIYPALELSFAFGVVPNADFAVMGYELLLKIVGDVFGQGVVSKLDGPKMVGAIQAVADGVEEAIKAK